MSIPEMAKKLWNEWDIRLFVLSSLFLQVLLIILAPIRKRKLSRKLSPFIWAFYLLADWVAAFSLGLLSDSQNDNNCGSIANKIRRSAGRLLTNNTNKELQAFWAPFLLLHLGGPDTITAFALEDNELWLRHLLGLIFEVAMAGYVFSRAFPMKRLLIPTLLMFFAGTVKYGERTRALYLASMDGFRDSMLEKPDPGPNYAKLMNELTSKKEASLPAKITINKELNTTLNITDDEEPKAKLTNIEVIRKAHQYVKKFKGLIANLIFSFNDRKDSQSFFKKLTAEDAFRVVEAELNFIYEVLYTKGAVVHTGKAYVLRALCSCAILASLILFVFAKKHNYDPIDTAITYSLLGGAAALDVVALTVLILSDFAIISFTTRFNQLEKKSPAVLNILEKIQSVKNPRWSESIAQYNLIDYCLVRHPKCINWTASKIGLKDLLDHFLYTSYKTVDTNLKKFIFSELMKKSERAKDSRSIKMMCSYRGSGALEERGYQTTLGWSVEAEFDESLLLWHIATDICYNLEEGNNQEKDTATNVGNSDSIKQEAANSTGTVNKESINPEEGNSNEQKTDTQPDYREMSRNLSDYMLYLLVVQPSMMSSMAGIGLIRYRDTCAEAKMFFPPEDVKEDRSKSEAPKKEARKMLNGVKTDIFPKDVKGDRSKSVLFDAVRLAKQLNELPEKRKWIIISEVWVELLSYAASHCRGHAHAARLSKGGELLMFVWFLMTHLGLGEQFCIEAGHATAKLIVNKELPQPDKELLQSDKELPQPDSSSKN
ncbi:hypothetical protein AQUCO_03800204v1 [Aquilegia coerulea]|uniref:DUF4220 domain-containing protein n=1 Tax=Aquilegia coerulea TaxID=218851 RepID=A0A2G5CT17_AQUCA|nr:hypothetical protein AQUCO_03800204v1 [Aquilegia coerulea]PIA34423.1 hypothetical protein AQUCO_03800204v1 [Aquilegia coerulea]